RLERVDVERPGPRAVRGWLKVVGRRRVTLAELVDRFDDARRARQPAEGPRQCGRGLVEQSLGDVDELLARARQVGGIVYQSIGELADAGLGIAKLAHDGAHLGVYGLQIGLADLVQLARSQLRRRVQSCQEGVDLGTIGHGPDAWFASRWI